MMMVLSYIDSAFFLMSVKLKENLENLKALIEERNSHGLSDKALKLREKLLVDNFPLVLDRLSKINYTKKITEDDIQNGMLGLLETIDKFDPKRASSLGSLGHYRIMHNCDRYKEHPGGIKIPKTKLKEYKYYLKNLIEDRYFEDEESKTKLELIMEEAHKILEPEYELPIFCLKVSCKVTYKELTAMFNLNRSEITRIYNRAYNKVITHCRETLNNAINK